MKSYLFSGVAAETLTNKEGYGAMEIGRAHV
jgi:uncharacterized alpha-E superfamily protein